MAASGTPLAEIDEFTEGVYPPAAGTPQRAEDVEIGLQSLTNRTRNLKNVKANLAGATFTGSVTFQAPSTFEDSVTHEAQTFVEAVVSFTGPQPSSSDDPGVNSLYATNITKGRGTIQIVNGTVTVLDGYNIQSAVVSGGDPTELVITFKRAMADVNYGVTFGMRNHASRAREMAYAQDGSFNLGSFGMSIVDNATGTIKNLSATGTYRFAFTVDGRQ